MQIPPEQWILRTLYEAGKHSEDTFRVFQSLRKHLYTTTDMSMLTYNSHEILYKPTSDLADDCFFSICKFCEYLNKRAARTGSPDCMFYSRLGQESFNTIGYPNIADDWVFWVSYVKERFDL